MKRAVLYVRVSTVDQHPETQLYDLKQMAAQRGYDIVQAYTDRISGVKARPSGLDQLMQDARLGRFEVLLVWATSRQEDIDPIFTPFVVENIPRAEFTDPQESRPSTAIGWVTRSGHYPQEAHPSSARRNGRGSGSAGIRSGMVWAQCCGR